MTIKSSISIKGVLRTFSYACYINGSKKETTLHFIALRFKSDLADLIEPNRKPSLNCAEDSANENLTKHVLRLSKGWSGNEDARM